MRGQLTVRAGTYPLGDNVTLLVHASDAGTVIRLDDRQINRRYCGIIDEKGQLVWRSEESHALPTDLPLGPSLRSVGAEQEAIRRAARKLRPRKPPGPRRIKFVLKYTKAYRPRNSAFVLGAWMDRVYIHLLYRVEASGITYYENQLRISEDEVLMGDQIAPKERLAKERWPNLLAMPDHSTIRMARPWRKMSRDEIEKIIEGRTLQVSERSTRPD